MSVEASGDRTMASGRVEGAKHMILAGVPEGLDALVLADLVRNEEQTEAGKAAVLLHIARDDKRLASLRACLKFFAPGVRIISFPAWDCVPYDRVSPNAEISGRRIAALAQLANNRRKQPLIVLSTVNAVLQRVPPRDTICSAMLRLKPGDVTGMDALVQRLQASGFLRTGTVMELGEFAVRGGILDIFPPGRGRPVRLDFFGDTLESIRAFDPATQRTSSVVEKLTLLPVSEIPGGGDVVSRFRLRYVELFGTVTREDPLYQAISAGARYQGAEHWLPLFYEKLETIFDYIPGATVTFDHLAEDARARRLEQVRDHYEARVDALEQNSFGAPPYNPVPPQELFLEDHEWSTLLETKPVRFFTAFEVPDKTGGLDVMSFKGRQGRAFAAERKTDAAQVFDAVTRHIRDLQAAGKQVVIACWSAGARERLKALLADHGAPEGQLVESWQEVLKLPATQLAFAVLGVETGFETPNFAILGEQDILGDRLIRRRRRAKRGSEVLSEVASLGVGDLVVHADHGIGRFEGLKAIEAAGAPHDCLELIYHGGDRLYLPVENIELLTRYGSDDTGAQLDRLGGSGWQSRKARLKQRIRNMAEKLLKVAAARALREAPVMTPPDGLYQEFCARFPYEETEDQETSIAAVLDDLAAGRPMDRLICGDVGFGKTEVALRSALVSVMAGKQVAVVVPTTLLARQHTQTFLERFQGLPVRIAQVSRLVSARDLATAKKDIASGELDIVIGTHALLGKSIKFADLGLLIIDEEQHFGVQHKESLKQMREDIHVLTLTATPIPRTLQLALSGVRELSLITTPPVDRLAVRTFVTPFDPVILREALLRERYRGGQSFFVCPRISDLDEASAFLTEHVPELKVARAHGKIAPGELEDVMNAFYDRSYDVLLSTTIVESGLDIPTANTLIVYRADMFGLAQLYQLRGRVGRSKIRAYAFFTIPANANLTPTAEKRLKVLQSLDTLGAGFSLASHDMDIRGSGNLLGEEQSGHIKEVGFELYQSMLEDAVAALRGGDGLQAEDQWSPQIAIGTSVLIPEKYVPDLQSRLGLYRRLSKIETGEDIEEFAAELVDRFGALPEEVRHLLDIVRIKSLCRQAGVEQVDAGPKGAVFTFRNKSFANPEGLIALVMESPDVVKIQPDHKLIFRADWETSDERLEGTRLLVKRLADIASGAKCAA